MTEREPMETLPAVAIYPVPDPAPARVPENIDAALRCIGGALTALNFGGYEVEHHETSDGVPAPYGIIWQAAADLLDALYPGIDGEAVVRDRWFHADLPAAVKDALNGR